MMDPKFDENFERGLAAALLVKGAHKARQKGIGPRKCVDQAGLSLRVEVPFVTKSKVARICLNARHNLRLAIGELGDGNDNGLDEAFIDDKPSLKITVIGLVGHEKSISVRLCSEASDFEPSSFRNERAIAGLIWPLCAVAVLSALTTFLMLKSLGVI